jgi:hypothetical protein
LLRTDLLPLRLDGFFCLAQLLDSQTYFFSRPSNKKSLDNLTNDDDHYILDHCNGVLLFWERVVNPATRQWVHLPPFPQQTCPGMEGFYPKFFLAYDPLMSPHHYMVLNFPLVPFTYVDIKFTEDSEWPPSIFTTHLFSSTKPTWEERTFVREGEATGTIADMRFNWNDLHRHTVYFKGQFYVHCQNHSIMRYSFHIIYFTHDFIDFSLI